MGHRANLLIVENRRYTIYYSHWCANTITRDLFWGPDHALHFVRMQRRVDDSGWLDDVWAEGAAVIDCDRRVLLLYGGQDIRHDVPLRRVYLAMLGRVWRNWEVRWAHEGIAEVADYVEYPRAKVLAPDDTPNESTTELLAPPEQLDWTDLIGSFRLGNGELQLFPLAGNVEDYLRAGPRLVEQRSNSSSFECVPFDEWVKEAFPHGGFHIDESARRVDYWIAADAPNTLSYMSIHWPGWQVTWHRDDYESQLLATAGRIRLRARSKTLLQEQVKVMLLHQRGRSPAETILEMAKSVRTNVEINPWALEDPRMELDLAERQRIVAEAIGE